MIKIIVNGAFGKMGQETVRAITQQPDLVLLASLGRQDDLCENILHYQPDVVIDFTGPDCVFNHTKIILECGSRPSLARQGYLYWKSMSFNQWHWIEN